MLSSLWPPGAKGADPDPDPPAPLVSTWKVRTDAGEASAIVRVRNLQSVMAAGRDAWGREAKPQPVLLSSEVSFARPFSTASADDSVNAETVHYGNLSKTLLGGIELFSSPPTKKKGLVATHRQESPATPRTADVFELLWVQMTGRVVDGSRVALPLDQVPFLDAAKLRSLSLTIHLPKASLLGDGVSLTTTTCFVDADELTDEKKKNPQRSYARSLRLHSLRVPTLIGVNPNEREAKQMVVVDVEIDCFDVLDDIHTELEGLVVATLEASSFETLEALGTHVADKILDEFRIQGSPQRMRERGWQIKVCLEKPIAVPFADCPAVEVRVGS
ncbi:Dihydroneopterin aldolase-domain-containing protein [Xylaria bambusicola]|uniref:Dihydroneopterin aldolase-domain-containing protein n=1 Tax=Xylaria bambusicola TaxID=326684 RepID=UPI002008BB26|nr:Dihydroneopterin aldolase-domain-containing protein [Xylaria bambusicola]KAI0506118.1 Dihydroneopterin aldolase-domain-containing protein [Xylaria bambusicola]